VISVERDAIYEGAKKLSSCRNLYC